MRMMPPHPVERKQNPNTPEKTQRYYKVLEKKYVCRNAFKSLHGISESKLGHITKLKKESPENIARPDMRGKSKFGINIFIDDNVKYLFNRPSC